MIDEVASYIEKYHMIEPGDHVIAGVSGGADSVCLFLILERLRYQMGFSMSAVHVEHGLRGAQSRKDQDFAVKLAEEFKITISCYAYKVDEIAKHEGLSVEEAARKVRYASFTAETKKYRQKLHNGQGNIKVAVAHHGNDNAETLLFHMCRGSGIDGLAGIRPVRDNIIRPLLCVSRDEIEDYLHQEQQSYCTDATNGDVNYARNRIRVEVIPALTKVNSRTVSHLNQIAKDMRELSDYIKSQALSALDKHMVRQKNGNLFCTAEVFSVYPKVVGGIIALELIAAASGSRRDISRDHAEKIMELSAGQVGRSISLPDGLTAEKTYGGILIYRRKVKTVPGEETVYGEIPAKILVIGDRGSVRCPYGNVDYRIINYKKDEEIPKNQCTKWFDYDKITDMLFIRTRKPGDYFVYDDAGRRQKLKDYFINEKVPKAVRDQVVLLAEDRHILWAAGCRISEYYKITEATGRILEVQYMEEERS